MIVAPLLLGATHDILKLVPFITELTEAIIEGTPVGVKLTELEYALHPFRFNALTLN